MKKESYGEKVVGEWESATGNPLRHRADLIKAIDAALKSAREEERAYIVRQIRENATTLTFFAGGRALDLLAWILELPEGPKR